MIKRLLVATLVIAMAGLFVMPTRHASAYDVTDGIDCSKTGQNNTPSTDPSNSAICNSKSKVDAAGNPVDPISGTDGILQKATDVIAIVAGIGAVIIMIVGGIKYITSNGDANNITSAKNTIVNAIIGLVVIVAARTIINFVLNKI